MHGMPRLGVTRLIFAALVIFCLGAIGLSIHLPLVQLLPFILAGWLGTGILCALRADHDLNLLQMERFHQGENESDVDSLELDVYPILGNDSMDLHFPTPKDKILN